MLTDEKQIPALESTLNVFMKPPPNAPPNPMTAALQGAKITTTGPELSIDIPLPDDMTQGLLGRTGFAPPPGAYPPGAYPPGMPPGGLPPGTVIVPPGGLPPGTTLPPGAVVVPPPSAPPAPKKPQAVAK